MYTQFSLLCACAAFARIFLRNGRAKLDFATATSQWTINCWAFGLLTLCLFSRGSTSTSAEEDVVNARPRSRELSTYSSSYYSTFDEREYLYDRYLDSCAYASDLFDCFCHPEDFSDGECNYLNNYELCNYGTYGIDLLVIVVNLLIVRYCRGGGRDEKV